MKGKRRSASAIRERSKTSRRRGIDERVFAFCDAALVWLQYPQRFFFSLETNEYALTRWNFALAPYYDVFIGVSIITSAVWLFILLRNNRRYEIFRFPTTLALSGALAYLILSSTAAFGRTISTDESNVKTFLTIELRASFVGLAICERRGRIEAI